MADLGDHAAAVIWCAGNERRGRDASYPDLLGWAAPTRSLIAWYQGDPLSSSAASGLAASASRPESYKSGVREIRMVRGAQHGGR